MPSSGIEGAEARVILGAVGELEEGIAQEGGVAVVEILQRLHRFSRHR